MDVGNKNSGYLRKANQGQVRTMKQVERGSEALRHSWMTRIWFVCVGCGLLADTTDKMTAQI
jgi:hypothetical protein